MREDNAMTFSNMEECDLPWEIKSWLLAPGKREKQVKEEIWKTLPYDGMYVLKWLRIKNKTENTTRKYIISDGLPVIQTLENTWC